MTEIQLPKNILQQMLCTVYSLDKKNVYTNCNSLQKPLINISFDQSIVGLKNSDISILNSRPNLVETLDENNTRVMRNKKHEIYQEKVMLSDCNQSDFISCKLPLINNSCAFGMLGISYIEDPGKIISHYLKQLSLRDKLLKIFEFHLESVRFIKSMEKYSGFTFNTLHEHFISKINIKRGRFYLSNASFGEYLTMREFTIIRLFSRCYTLKEIALQLSISPRTVEYHINNIKLRLGCNKKSEIIENILLSDLGYLLYSNEILFV